MVVASSTEFSKALASPASVVQELFEQQHKQSSSSTSPSPSTSTGLVRDVQAHFDRLFSEADARAKISPLTGKVLKEFFEADRSARPSRLVRWRCMIQDTNMGDEVTPYQLCAADGTWKSALFGGASNGLVTAELDLDPSNMASLTTMYGVSLPGQTDWYRRQVEQPGLSEDAVALLQLDETALPALSGVDLATMKRKLPTKKGFGALLKLYDEDLAETLRVANVVDLVGILDEGVPPTSGWAETGAPEHAFDESNATSSQPAIHVLSLSPVKTLRDAPPKQGNDATDREVLLEAITRSLGGDRLSAEWLLLSLLAKIHTRKGSNVVGSLSLNLSHFPSPTSPSSDDNRVPFFFNIISHLLPLSVHQPMSLSHLNEASNAFSPASASSGGLDAGRLQLVDGTLVLLDETSMDEGQLREGGINNIRTLSTVLQTKRLAYAFPFGTNVEMDVDLRFLVVSNGKSFLPLDVQVPLDAKDQASLYSSGGGRGDDNEAVAMLGGAKADGLRAYLARAQDRIVGITIPEPISEKIQDDFVESRTKGEAQGKPRMEQEDLVRRLNVARLIAASKGSDTVEWDCYREATRLDEQRQERLARLQPSVASASETK